MQSVYGEMVGFVVDADCKGDNCVNDGNSTYDLKFLALKANTTFSLPQVAQDLPAHLLWTSPTCE